MYRYLTTLAFAAFMLASTVGDARPGRAAQRAQAGLGRDQLFGLGGQLLEIRLQRGVVVGVGERFTPGQHWQPWPSGRHHRYWHGGVTSAFCYGIISIPDRRCYERHW